MKLPMRSLKQTRDFSCWHKFVKSEKAVAAVEAAFMLPIFLAVFFGVLEFSRMMLIQQKLEKTVSAMGDFITQGAFACSTDIQQFRVLAVDMMKPFAYPTPERNITFTSIVNNNNDIEPCAAGRTCVSWQDGARTKIGAPGDIPAALPGGLQVIQGQNYIITELYYKFEPLLPLSTRFISGAYTKEDVYLFNIHKPRIGTLSELDPPDCEI